MRNNFIVCVFSSLYLQELIRDDVEYPSSYPLAIRPARAPNASYVLT
jgi:hypothetical protein